MSGHSSLSVSRLSRSPKAFSSSVGMDLAAHSAIMLANSINHCCPSADFKRALSAAIDFSLTLSCVGGFRLRVGLEFFAIETKSAFSRRYRYAAQLEAARDVQASHLRSCWIRALWPRQWILRAQNNYVNLRLVCSPSLNAY